MAMRASLVAIQANVDLQHLARPPLEARDARLAEEAPEGRRANFGERLRAAVDLLLGPHGFGSDAGTRLFEVLQSVGNQTRTLHGLRRVLAAELLRGLVGHHLDVDRAILEVPQTALCHTPPQHTAEGRRRKAKGCKEGSSAQGEITERGSASGKGFRGPPSAGEKAAEQFYPGADRRSLTSDGHDTQGCLNAHRRLASHTPRPPRMRPAAGRGGRS
mmetsp:Transcript_38219/g.100999  ORF Transcript_38219/g.100999 Transcript_38219/m.100999 type:complete len:217 (-) Transcript_38219:1-651(-)